MSSLQYSSQVFIVSLGGDIILEDNKKIGSLSCIGGKLEEGESYIDAIKREVQEEVGLVIIGERFVDFGRQKPRKFPTGVWVTNYFGLVLSESEFEAASGYKNMKIFERGELNKLDNSSYPFNKVEFLAHVDRALGLIS